MPQLRGFLSPDQVRALEGLRDTVRSEQTYRFHGHNKPQRIVNEIAAGPVEDGTAVLRLYDPIDSWGGEWGVSAKEFTSTLDNLGRDVQTIQLHLNSPGGEVFEGIAILNALRNHKAKVVAVVDGIAASAASFIACGADELVMGQNAELMIHDARGICMGNAGDMQQMTDLLNHLSDNIASVYAAKAGGTKADWRTAMLAETWFSADEAVAAGLADRVEGDTEQPTNTFDLSIFAHAGRADAPVPTLVQSADDAEKPAEAPSDEVMQPHEFADSSGDGCCDVCGLTEDEHLAPGTTASLRHRYLARKHGFPAA